jgi:hypothetical protein
MTTQARETLRSFILSHNPGIAAEDVDDHTPLIQRRLLTSVQLLDLLVLVESIRQRPVDVQTMSPSAFTDIDSMVRTFLPNGE